ncbi:MAG: Na/Pi cotransporter family protein [Gammaproteobacteria bacterium]|nr:Na/Pi cotransporter family protein [Gammaproteobacteria bacterium]MDH3537657.1 Na/Pi cotransporter family protein [Gammaproteobacteria bacterium]
MNLIGGVALLLWGLRMVRIGVSEAWGSEIRGALGASLQNRFKAFASGLGVTMLLQSSSATALLTSSFSGQGILTTATALAVLLGADVGTALVAQILTFDLSALSPILIAVGVAVFTYSPGGRARDCGRITLGIGMMLLALKLIVAASLPMRESLIVQQIFVALGEDLVLAIVFAAIIAWASHSSLATVLLVISLASTNAIEITVAFALVLGANIGSAIPPFIATLGASRSARQPPLGNLLFRIAGVLIALPFLDLIASQFSPFAIGSARQIANFHMLFNVLLVVLFLPLIDRMVALTELLLPMGEPVSDPMEPRELDRGAFENPLVALVNAEREVLRMGDVVERMLRNAFIALKKDDYQLAQRTREMDRLVNEFYDGIKRYLTALARETLGEKESKRCTEILSFVTNLEHIGDIISGDLTHNIMRKKLVTHSKMSLQDREDLNSLYQPVIKTFQLSLSVFTSGDVAMARQLLARKYKFIKRERKAVMNHLQKIRDDSAYDSRLSAMQLDVVRDLKRINSHLTSVAYPILEQAGQLRDRLRRSKHQSAKGSRVASANRHSPST